MEYLWKKAAGLKRLQNIIFDYDLYIFDIFSTVLLRNVGDVSFIYYHTARLNKNLLNSDVSAYDFMNIREEAEKYAKKIKENISLEDIYSQISHHVGDLDCLMRAEMETIKRYSFINPIIGSLIQYLLDNGKRVALTAGTYLSKEQVCGILAHKGFEIGNIENVYIFPVGNIGRVRLPDNFNCIKELYPTVSSSKMLFLSGNSLKIAFAEKAELAVCHYQFVDEMPVEALSYESILKRHDIQGANAPRLLPASINPYVKEDEKFWFDTGAIVFGAFFTYFAEWIVDIAETEKIKNIYPIMSEGAFFAKLIENALISRNLRLNVKPLFASRASVSFSAVDLDSERGIKRSFEPKGYFSLAEYFADLNLKDLFPEKLDEYADIEIKELRKSKEITCLLVEEIKKLSRQYKERAVQRERLAYNYLASNYDFNDAILIDIGYQGGSIGAINKMLEKHGTKPANLVNILALNHRTLASNQMDGINFKVFCKYDTQTSLYLKEILRFTGVLDGICIHNVISTVGYAHKDGEIVPVFSNERYEKEQIRASGFIQEGIFAFQKILYVSKIDPAILKETVDNKLEILKSLYRLFTFPTNEEARFMPVFKFQSEFKNLPLQSYIPDSFSAGQYDSSGEMLIKKYDMTLKPWKNAMAVLIDPLFSLKVLIHNYFGYGSDMAKAVYIAEQVRSAKVSGVVVYGAGDMGRKLQVCLKILRIRVEFFVDREEVLHGSKVNGVMVYPIGELGSRSVKNIAVGSIAFLDEILAAIKTFCEDAANIFYYDI